MSPKALYRTIKYQTHKYVNMKMKMNMEMELQVYMIYLPNKNRMIIICSISVDRFAAWNVRSFWSARSWKKLRPVRSHATDRSRISPSFVNVYHQTTHIHKKQWRVTKPAKWMEKTLCYDNIALWWSRNNSTYFHKKKKIKFMKKTDNHAFTANENERRERKTQHNERERKRENKLTRKTPITA